MFSLSMVHTAVTRAAFAAAVTVAMLAASFTLIGDVADADINASHDAVVSDDASFLVPEVLDGRVDAVAVVGDTVVVGGSFTQVRSVGGPTLTLPYIFAFSKATGQIDTNFDPVLNKAVFTLEAGSDSASVFVGGAFTTVNGAFNKKGLTKLDLSGDRITTFAGRTNARVKTMVRHGEVLYIGGTFTKIRSTPVEILAALDATTGEVLSSVDFDFADPYSSAQVNGTMSVDEIDVTADGQTMVVVGNFSSIDGQSRSRLAVLDLSGGTAVLSSWNTDVYYATCPSSRFPQYVFGMDISPDGSYFVTGSAGFYRIGEPACDSILRFELNTADSNVQPTWENHTGGDSVYEVAVSGEAVYAGGHFRRLNNPLAPSGTTSGPGAVFRAGLAALDPLNGLPLSWRSDRSPRGLGTFELLIEDDGLWVGDDTDFINGAYHPRIKFLPLAGGDPIPRPVKPVLPTTIFRADSSALTALAYDGSTFGAPNTTLASAWQLGRGAMFLSGVLFYGATDGNLYRREWNGTGFEARTQVDLKGIGSSEWDIADVGGMYFDHDQGRIYYTLTNDSRLFYRYFTPEHPLVGPIEFVAEDSGVVPWSDVRGMDRIGDQLYFGRSNGDLNRVDLVGASPISGTVVTLSGPGIDGRDWQYNAMTFFDAGDVFGPPSSQADFEFEGSGSFVQNSFETFSFPVAPGEDVTVKLEWDDPNAAVNVFLRDETGTTVAADNGSGGSPKWISAPAGNGGTWSVAVKIKSGGTAYTVLVNPFEDPPAPRAEYEFAASGSETEGSFKRFRFPVVAGEQVDVQLEWADANALLNLFLRDETGTKVIVDTTPTGSPKTLSAVAATTGEWSVAVKIKSGSTEYDVLVDTTDP